MNLKKFKEISKVFKGILLDAYGVFWGGNSIGLLPGSKEIMQYLIDTGKVVGVLSNSTQLSLKAIVKLKNHGLEIDKHFNFYMTSGDVAKDIFLNNKLPFKINSNKYFLFSDPHPKYASHEAIFEGTIFKETKNLDEADFIYISTPHIDGKDQTDPEVFRHDVEKLVAKKKIMICPNPDRFAHEGNPAKQVVRQGSIAKLYEEMDGKVYYIGKPSALSFSYAMEKFEKYGLKKDEIIMVGDTPETDILGANNFGVKSCLITESGIFADRIKIKGFDLAINTLSDNLSPTFLIKRFQ